jgi:hypothetical protein
MAQGKARDPQRERVWRRHVRRQRGSGLTIRDYCAQHGLPASAFHFWRREIAVRDEQQRAATPVPVAPAFVPVTVVPTPTDAGSAIDIRLRGGHRLRVRSGCDPHWLAAVVALLEGRPC